MPNWCSNSLTVHGCKESIQQFYDDNRTEETELQFQKSVPAVEETTKEQSEAWGTKWDLEDCGCYKDEQSISYSFDSAWSPPENWLKSVAQLYPDLTFELEYRETGNCFQGIITAQGDGFKNEQQEFIPDEDDE